MVCVTSKATDKPNFTSDQSLHKSLEHFMTIKLLTEHNLEFLSLNGGYTGSPESTLVKKPNCWKSHVAAQLYTYIRNCIQRSSVLETVNKTQVSGLL